MNIMHVNAFFRNTFEIFIRREFYKGSYETLFYSFVEIEINFYGIIFKDNFDIKEKVLCNRGLYIK